jgi:transposase
LKIKNKRNDFLHKISNKLSKNQNILLKSVQDVDTF